MIRLICFAREKNDLNSEGSYVLKRFDISHLSLKKRARARVEILHFWDRDIKIENILVSSSQDGEEEVKLCDFGYSIKVDDSQLQPKSPIGTQSYVPPEILAIQSTNEEKAYDGKKADVWSCGITLFVMLTGNGSHLRDSRSD
eukprot:jgi/Botrbrau1/838/Bobra.0352s0032.1